MCPPPGLGAEAYAVPSERSRQRSIFPIPDEFRSAPAGAGQNFDDKAPVCRVVQRRRLRNDHFLGWCSEIVQGLNHTYTGSEDNSARFCEGKLGLAQQQILDKIRVAVRSVGKPPPD